ncbi:MAG: AAA family ATPase [Thermoplasmata archaeon]|nr:AAA family ATPase [Thermoplasmata archaeon]
MESMGATQIVGPKGCGKTTTAKQLANMVIEFQDEDKRESYLLQAENRPSQLLKGKKPILFVEWQDIILS